VSETAVAADAASERAWRRGGGGRGRRAAGKTGGPGAGGAE
jgi:hypothetical protein